jgi:hypothetical protein
MAKFDEMDKIVTLSEQLEENVSPIILINKFNVKPEEADQFLKAWADDAAYFKSQPGFISAQLHRGIGGSGVFVNYAVGSLVRSLGRLLITLTWRQYYRIILPARSYLLTSLGKLQ